MASTYTGISNDPVHRKMQQRAISLVAKAIREGVLVRGACEVCGTTERIHGHHDDYTKPLEVRWLCLFCHANLHADRRNAAAKIRFAKQGIIDAVDAALRVGFTAEEIVAQVEAAVDREAVA